ncbi:MAG: metal-dependent hydrolase [Megasphaera sp.]|jgi:L-ascorbate metabolism protein UlaG (beta-lactamase superfamily)|uniref:metal-dependent hydrolase n=1 Tax=Megasphaera sueciensis TaxID=349094 RepID=UPI003D06D0EE|nr:metal-dependent hydrolase [Megasphaera sp.]MCI1823645.1 metal-dependent hydrolase [Megasphaera sp.]
MKFTYYGHSAFLLTEKNTAILFDPFITDNPWTSINPASICCQYIFISHAHSDHYGDAEIIAKTNNATIISTAEVAAKAANAGCKTHAMHIGGKAFFPFGYIRLTPALHGSGIAGGLACGCIIQINNKLIYFAGDTGLYADMKLHSRFSPIDYAILPIGDNFTMGIEDAAIAASWIQPGLVIPIHYKTWPIIDKDPMEYKKLVEEHFHIPVQVIAPGTTYEF